MDMHNKQGTGDGMINEFKSGFVGVFGRANVGKSTLVNRLVGSLVSITSHKPQTTRNRVLGVRTGDMAQMILVDTPGIHKAKNALGALMNKEARAAVADADVRMLMLSAADGLTELDRDLMGAIAKRPKAPDILVINKTDAVKKPEILKITDEAAALHSFDEIVPISAKTGDNVGILTGLIEKYLPNGPMFFPVDYITDKPERAIWAELVRARALLHLRDEVPHGIAAEVLSVEQKPGIINIDITIYCEKNSHKGIVIGKGGEMLKTIGKEARIDLERFIGEKVNLKLWVKIKKNWRDSAALAGRLAGFALEK
jgi:GTP-binding protein Era